MATYAKGHVRAPDKDALMAADGARRGPRRLQAMKRAMAPSSWDSRTQGIIGPVKDQGQCGCHAEGDEVLTLKGWKKWEDYDWITPLGTMNQATGFLEFQSPIQRHVYDYDGPMYYSDNRCLDFALTPNHRMYVRKWDERRRTLSDRYQFVEISKIGWYAGLPHATTGFLGTQLNKLQIGDREYDGDDFLALLALIVSDGWAGGSESTKNVVSFCCFRDDRIEMVKALAYRLGMHEVPSRPGVWMHTDGALAEWVRKNAYTGNDYHSPSKRVPDLVKVASGAQIARFLEFFGDQHIGKEGSTDVGIRRFYSSSRQMIDDLQELLLRIGKRGTIEEREPRVANFGGRDIHSKNPDLTLTERSSEKLSMERKKYLKTDHYKGKVYCASVPNGLLVTRRNGSVLVSGNSCWCFSGTFVVEVALYLAGALKPDGSQALSEQYILDCGSSGGCNGDDNTNVLKWAKATGMPLTADYGPYTASSGSCQIGTKTLYKLQDWGFADGANGDGVTSAASIKAAIMSYGCAGNAIAADDAFMNIKPGTVFQGSGSSSIDHDVALIGWDDARGSVTGSIDPRLAHLPTGGKTAWILRNSWGASWVDNGYCWIEEGANLVGTEAVWAVATGSAIDWYF